MEPGQQTGRIRDALIAWCLAVLDHDAVEQGNGRISQQKREAFLRHCHDRRMLWMMARDLAEGIEDLAPHDRDAFSAMLAREHGVDHRMIVQHGRRKVLQVLERGRVKNEDELRRLIAFASDQGNPGDLREQCDVLVAAYHAGGGAA